MKFRKSIIVTSLASVMAVSMVGAITGTVAWYQYSTRATVSMVGMNVAETGILEISTTSATEGFKRDLSSAEILTAAGRTDFNMTPVTLATGANQTATSALPNPVVAYKNPDVVNKEVASDGSDYATRGSFADAWDEADDQDYIQFDMWIRARTVDNATGGFTQTAEDVYLTDAVLANIGSGAIVNALRIHLAIDANGDGDTADAGDKNLLLSKSTVSGLELYGKLDQDNDGIADRVGGYEWATHRSDHITYGEGTYTQTTTVLDDMVAERDDSNNYAIKAADSAKKLFTTPATSGATKVTFTIWVEGWDKTVGSKNAVTYTFTPASLTVGDPIPANTYVQYDLNGTPVVNNYVPVTGTVKDGVSYFTRSDPADNTVADWSGLNTDGAKFQFGLTFDVGRDAFKD